MQSLFILIDQVIGIYIFVVFIHVVLSWLVSFNVVNPRNQFIHIVGTVTYRLTEPILGRIRRFMPDLGGLDISPVVLLLALYFLRNLIREMFAGRL